MSDEPVPALDYDRTPPGYVTRRRHRLLVAIPWLILAALLLIAVLPVALMTLRGFRLRGATVATPAPVAIPTVMAAATTSPPAPDVFAHYGSRLEPPGAVTYEEEPVAAAALLAGPDSRYTRASMQQIVTPFGDAFQPPAMRFMPLLAAYEASLRAGTDAVTIAAVDRTSPGGNRRLVMLNLGVSVRGRRANDSAPYLMRLERQLSYRVFAADPAGANPRLTREGVSLKVLTPEGDEFPIVWKDGVLKADRPLSANVRVLGAVCDPADASHFTVPFTAGNTGKGHLDVWLGDDDFLRVVPSTGTVAGGDWYLTGRPPATRAGR